MSPSFYSNKREDGTIENLDALIECVARDLGAVEGVEAVVLGGSGASGAVRAGSDIDLGLYYHQSSLPSIEALTEVARRLDDRGAEAAVTDIGAWGPWINGGAWLQIEGQKVDWLYRNLDLVRATIATSRTGRFTMHYQPGHPFGLPSFLYLGEIALCRPLYDPRGTIADLKALAVPYPALLRQAIVDRFLWEAEFALETARRPADRGDAVYVAGCLFRAAIAMVQVLFALNERYVVNEKGSVDAAADLPLRPPDFTASMYVILGRAGENADELGASVQAVQEVLAKVRGLTGSN